jgi:hypothetical protein
MNFVPITRLFTIAMAAVVCFALIVPLALQRHNTALAVGISALFIVYLAVNVVLWQRTKPRA